jgi:hypothetical protein
MGTTSIDNSAPRCFAERYSGNDAWFFYGWYVVLYHTNVYDAFRSQAVALLGID